jgi:hypothetical protein
MASSPMTSNKIQDIIKFAVKCPDGILQTDIYEGTSKSCSEAHPAPYPMSTWGSFPGGKVAGAWSWPLTSI